MMSSLAIAALSALQSQADVPFSREEWRHGRSEISEAAARYGRGVGSLQFMIYGRDPGSFYYAIYGREVGSLYYWQYGREEGSAYFWRYGRTPGSEYYWRFGEGCLSDRGWTHGARCGSGAPPVLLTLCIARVIAIEPCSIIDGELDAWIGRLDSSSSFRQAERIGELREGRPAPE